MERDLGHLALAALTHDLRRLMNEAGVELLASAQCVLDLADLRDRPELETLLEQAGTYATGGQAGQLAADQALLSIFSRVRLYQEQEPAPRYYGFGLLPSTEQDQGLLFPSSSRAAAGLKDHLQAWAAELDWLSPAVEAEQFELVYLHLLALL